MIVGLNEDNLVYAVGLAKEMHSLSTFAVDGPEFNWDFCKHMMRMNMQDPNSYFAMAHDNTGYVGAVVGRVMPFFFNSQPMGVEDAWYVRAGTIKRASIGKRLMLGFVDWCINTKGALMVQSGDIAAIRSLGVDTLYKHMGFTRYGSIYKYVEKK